MFGLQEAYDVATGENEYTPTGGGNFDPMKSDTTSMNDYTRSVYPSYVQNGYRGALILETYIKWDFMVMICSLNT